ncbi:MAG TPA: hypothetical protein PLR26_02975 [Bacilli bacterium]|nr:hypothetical protein [Bacilli bacterium]
MKNFKQVWAEGKSATHLLNDARLKGNQNLKAFVYSLLVAFVVAAPIILVFINLFGLYAIGSTMFIILASLAGVMMCCFNGFASVVYVMLLKQYFKEVKELNQIKLKALFVVECFNLPVVILVIAIVVYFSFF